MKVLLTGATGYIGHELALALASKGIIVHALVRDIESERVPKHKNIVLFKGDICNHESIEKAIDNCDYVFHTAAYTNLKDSRIDSFYNTNVLGTENILNASLKFDVKKVIYTSTLSVFGPSYKDVFISENQPRIVSYANDYELTKGMSEERVNEYRKKGLSSIILNVSKVYGPGPGTYSNGVNRLISMFLKKDVLIVPNKLESESNYVFIKDVVNAHILAMESDISNGKYIIGGENISYNRLFNTIKTLTKSKIRVVKINYDLVKVCVFILNLLKVVSRSNPVVTPKVIDSLFVNRLSTSEKAKKELHYKTTSFGVGLKETIQYLNKVS
ncbi:NAD-dependent epimerase/dehydratase family protein [Seonamhaeicola aphaedonensis]|uniref:Farnesol dehydrogenase n=1 Tax=Seonamhaeicola aphaedonensis TaxID=1461338 RepID=A0A3D9HKX0_9FLAO|nr:NAD-dependent epimerase/dehydratase family protein [Seonamhaeicola aphaedonensis]RED50152.1 farnesol dehydrogenase [Seonamhaeicola aphaedonensis]